MASLRKKATTGAVLALFLIAVTGFLVACGDHKDEVGKWHCPMHPTYVSDRPGDCPICGMRLVPIGKDKTALKEADHTAQHATAEPKDAGAAKPAPLEGERKILYYRSPMDVKVTSPTPAKDSMGMDFVPVYADEVSSGASKVIGYAPIEISTEALQVAGVQSAPATLETLGRTVRTVGSVMPAESEVRHIHTKISGWVEKLYVNSTGQPVRRGQPVLSIYSQELLASQEEYLRARASGERFSQSSIPEVRNGGEDLVRAARRRLELFDVPEEFLKALEETGKPVRTVPILAPISGFVTMKDTFEGQQVDPGMDLFTIADLSRVWIEAELYQYEVPDVSVGQPAQLTSPYDSGLSLEGRIAYIYPYLNPESRTLRVRFEFANPGFKLKPAMFVNVEMQLQASEGVVIPDSAVIDTGTRQIVFVDHGGGKFEPREVKVAARGEGKARLTSGLESGERVVTKANFLLDSESRLRAAIAGATGVGEHQHGGGQ
jgi:multidrug efflux pump subunit AcrA (membrane-fusion protein)